MPELCLVTSADGGGQVAVGTLWRSMGWIMRADVTLLAAMLAYVFAIACGKFYRFVVTRRHSRIFVQEVASALQSGNLNEAFSVAIQHIRGHVASIVAAGLTAFVGAAPQFTDAEAIGAAERAFQRRYKRIVADLKRGVDTLTSIAVCAPLVGLIGTVFGIMGAFVGGGDRASGLSYVAGGFAEALVTTSFGLLVAIPAVWCRNYTLISVEAFETEMSNSILETITYCKSHRHLRSVSEIPNAERIRSSCLLDDIAATRSWEVPYDRARGLLLLVSFYTPLLCSFSWPPGWRGSWEHVEQFA